MTAVDLSGRDWAPNAPGMPLWRVTLHTRAWTATATSVSMLAELSGARSRTLTRAWNTPAQFAFTLDGRDPAAGLVKELATEVMVWRSGTSLPMFRGMIDHAEDVVSEQAAVTNYVAHDYAAMLTRRYLTAPYSVTQRDQDGIVADLLQLAVNTTSSSGTSFAPGAWLPLNPSQRQPDGTIYRPASGQLRDRTYTPSSQIFQLIDDLSKVINGFDWEVRPFTWDVQLNANTDGFWIYYPRQGVTRTDMAFVYGANLAALTRTVSSSDYANYMRVVGNNGSSDPADPQLFSEAWNTDANNVTVNPVGLFMDAQNAADVSIQSTLDQTARGAVLNPDGSPGGTSGLLVPSYALTLRPGAYQYGQPNMGDVVPLIVEVGRLNVNTTVRVLGLEWQIGDDGQEDVNVTVGRPPTNLGDLFTQSRTDIDALARR